VGSVWQLIFVVVYLYNSFFFGKVAKCLKHILKKHKDEASEFCKNNLTEIVLTCAPGEDGKPLRNVHFESNAGSLFIQYPLLLTVGAGALPTITKLREQIESGMSAIG